MTSSASSPSGSNQAVPKAGALRVAVIMPLAEQRGGGELMLVHLVQQGRGKGIDWTIIFLQDGPMVAQARDYGIDAVVIPSGKMRNLPRLFVTAWKIARLARREKIDLLLGWMGTAQLYGGVASLMSGVPAAWYQLATALDRNIIDRIATRLPTRLIMTCSKMAADAQSLFTPRRPVRVVNPAVELERFDPDALPSVAEARGRLGLPIDTPIIGIVGRLQKWKGMHVLVEAMPEVLVHYPKARAVIVGGIHAFEPEYAESLETLVRNKGLTNQVTLTGLQSNVQEWMQAMDIVVHASDKEPFGIVVIEAMALGKPVIAADSWGPTEIITPGVDGLLTPVGDAKALAAAILKYLDDPAMRSRLGAAARRRAQDFSTARYAREVIACCYEACNRPAPPIVELTIPTSPPAA